MGYISRPTISGAICDVCGSALELISEDIPAAVNALNITLTGGLSQYFNGPPIALVFCDKCTNKLLTLFPVMEMAIEEHKRASEKRAVAS